MRWFDFEIFKVWVHLAITWNGKICFNISSVIDEQKYVGSNRLF